MKRFLADRFPSLYRYYLTIRRPYRNAVHIDRFVKYLNREHPGICVSLPDVGARGGWGECDTNFQTAKTFKQQAYPCIDPDTEEAERLRKSGEYDRIFTDGVAWYDGEAVLHVPGGDPSGASVRDLDYVETQRFFCPSYHSAKSTEYPVRVKKLGNVLPMRAAYDFIKIDTEGCDYDVLASAEPALLEKTLRVVCETRDIPIFKG